MEKNLTILGIESSCDETAAAIYTTQDGLLSNELFSQVLSHAAAGGVIPEVASREHMQQIILITASALQKANKTLHDVDIVAVTSKPGLPGPLMIGVAFAKGIAFACNKKLIGVDHLQGHLFSACIENAVSFPFIALTASGGHSAIYLVHDFTSCELLGATRDDAAGEAFDKVAKLMNLPYPGGPIIEKLAHAVQYQDFFSYPRGKMQNLDFSFSGLKTAVLYSLIEHEAYDATTKTFLRPTDIVFQQQVASSLLVCIADIFEEKITKALQQHPHVQSVCFVGGVACNKYLKSRLSNLCKQQSKHFFYPSVQLCTDNAGMIAFVGHNKAQKNQFDPLSLPIL